MKVPSLASVDADPMLFALFTGICIMIVSLPVSMYLFYIGTTNHSNMMLLLKLYRYRI